jgi:tellurite resistance protein TehA-like permease
LVDLFFVSYVCITLCLEVIIILLAYDISKVTGKAPRGWYVIIAGTGFLVLRSSILLASVFAGLNLSLDLNDLADVLQIVFGAFLVTGLFYFRKDFKSALKSLDWRTLTRSVTE